MGKFAAKIERIITIALILSMMLILIPGVSVQAKAKKCNHKSVTWITTSKPSCTDEGMKVKKCKNCGKILKIKKIKKSGHCLRTQMRVESSALFILRVFPSFLSRRMCGRH